MTQESGHPMPNVESKPGLRSRPVPCLVSEQVSRNKTMLSSSTGRITLLILTATKP